MSTDQNPEASRQAQATLLGEAPEQRAGQSTDHALFAAEVQQMEGSTNPPNLAESQAPGVKHDIVPMTPEQHSITMAASQTPAQAEPNTTP